MRPTSTDTLEAVLATFETYVAPDVTDDYAASLSLTIGQLLRSVLVRIEQEGDALFADNAELRALLEWAAPQLGSSTERAVRDALESSPIAAGTYPSVARLMVEADALRGALDTVIRSLGDARHPVRVAGRTYLTHQLERQAPWLLDAFTGPRR